MHREYCIHFLCHFRQTGKLENSQSNDKNKSHVMWVKVAWVRKSQEYGQVHSRVSWEERTKVYFVWSWGKLNPSPSLGHLSPLDFHVPGHTSAGPHHIWLQQCCWAASHKRQDRVTCFLPRPWSHTAQVVNSTNKQVKWTPQPPFSPEISGKSGSHCSLFI